MCVCYLFAVWCFLNDIHSHFPLAHPSEVPPVVVVLQAKTRELKQNLNNEFRSIHELCMFVLANTRKVELLRATLTALAAYLSWIPPGWFQDPVSPHPAASSVHPARPALPAACTVSATVSQQ